MSDFRNIIKANALRWVLKMMPQKSFSLLNCTSEKVVLGHRGYTKKAPENTIQACLDALAAGADGVEIDVKCSLDGIPFVFHDENLNRMTGFNGVASSLPLSQLQALMIKGPDTPLCDTIPSLDTFTEAMPDGILINIEIKDYPPSYHGFEAKVIKVIQAHQNRLHFVLSSFDPRALMRFRSLSDTLPLGCLMAPEQSWFLKYGLLIPAIRPDTIHPHYSMVDKNLVKAAHQKKLFVFAWTVNDVVKSKELKAIGVDGIITDESADLVQYLNGN